MTLTQKISCCKAAKEEYGWWMNGRLQGAKGATSRLVHLDNFSLNFLSWSFPIRVNLLYL